MTKALSAVLVCSLSYTLWLQRRGARITKIALLGWLVSQLTILML